MKKKLHKLTFIATTLFAAQMSFGQLVAVPLSNPLGGTPNYADGRRDDPKDAIQDAFSYDPVSPTSPYPDDNAGGVDNYFLAKNLKTDNWFSCTVAIPVGKSLKNMDFYARGDGNHDQRYTNLTITLSDGNAANDEVKSWGGITSPSATPNYAQMSFVTQGFSAAMLQNATSFKIDKSDVDEYLDFMELRLSADTTLSVDDLNATELVISPNPLEQGGQLKISLTNNSAINNLLQVYSIRGREIYKTNVVGSDVLIDYNVFPSAGLYLVKIGFSTYKVVIK